MQPTVNLTSPSIPTGADNVPTLLITGATGNIGSKPIKILSEQSVPFWVVVRSDEIKAIPDLLKTA